ncbi:hypothetical protein L3X38_033307 [Prunus dulcis]|uniref:Uncharacterized protein n=1 Tax=Prunus dulcis TaxID=3755 RepID=A0AAD4YWU7_PRUDU|nr:hypothetical protein L3X38_033307 [Prunus dulcis]
MVTALEEPILELEAHLTGVFEANNSKVEVSESTKKKGDKPLKVEKARLAPSKVKPLVAKGPTVTKLAQPTKVEKKEKNNQNMVQEAEDEPHRILSEPRVEEDQVMVDAETNVVEKEAEHKAEEEAKEPLENFEGSAAEDEELNGMMRSMLMMST